MNKLANKNGYARIQERLQYALSRYGAVCATNADAAGAGDSSVWHDNFAYEENQREMHKWARRIRDLKNLLSEVRVVATPAKPTTVQIGCAVVLRDNEENREWRFIVAGYDDGDIKQGRVSYTSPLMQDIFGGKIGDEYEVFLDDKKRTVAVATIRRAEEKEER